MIPKRIMNLEDKYLHYCLELVHIKASRSNSSIIPSKIETFPENFTSKALFLVSTRNENSPLVRLDAHDSYVSSSYGDYHHAKLHCSRSNGFTSCVFYAENQRDVFTANFLYNGEEFIYKIHSRANESDIVGEMTVSTSIKLCPHGTEMKETCFVLCVNDCNIEGDTHTSDQTQVKNKGLSKKVARICKGRQRSFAFEESLFEDGDHLSPPKLELAAIVVKDHTQKEVETGGWGLKFLKKDGFCESCSSSMNVLVPAGFHGGSGHSSLVERWRSGGSCDCGGWDLGCPLTVIHATPNQQNGVFVDLCIQGCKRRGSVLKMVKMKDGLYDLCYKSSLSALQCFSVALAAIHNRDRVLIC